MTSSNTGVPDISGSVYNKTQVSNAVLSSCLALAQADGPLVFTGSQGQQAMAFLILFAVGVESNPLSHHFCPVSS